MVKTRTREYKKKVYSDAQIARLVDNAAKQRVNVYRARLLVEIQPLHKSMQDLEKAGEEMDMMAKFKEMHESQSTTRLNKLKELQENTELREEEKVEMYKKWRENMRVSSEWKQARELGEKLGFSEY